MSKTELGVVVPRPILLPDCHIGEQPRSVGSVKTAIQLVVPEVALGLGLAESVVVVELPDPAGVTAVPNAGDVATGARR